MSLQHNISYKFTESGIIIVYGDIDYLGLVVISTVSVILKCSSANRQGT